MAVQQAMTPFSEYLPAILRTNAREGANFLSAFLGVFEQLFAGVQSELDALPDLFALTPTPLVAVAVAAEECTLLLDSAAGLCPGDILQLQAEPETPCEFVEIDEVEASDLALLPSAVHLRRALRFPHTAGARVVVVGRPVAAAALSLGVGSGATALTVMDAPQLGVEVGAILRIGDDETTEYAQVEEVKGVTLTIAPPLQSSHAVGEPVAMMQPMPVATPPAAFAYAQHDGAELVLRSPALAQAELIEVDTHSGLQVNDLLHIQDSDPTAVEFVQVDALPAAGPTPAVWRAGLHLRQPLRFAHATGTAIRVLGTVVGEAALAKPATANTLVIEETQAAFLDATVGDVLRVGRGATPEYVQVVAVTTNQEKGQSTLSVTPALTGTYDTGAPVVHLAPVGGGRAFLQWLAGWVGLALRPDRGERWNRELLRVAGRIWPWRGTKPGVEAFLRTYLREEVAAITIYAPANPLQIGLVSTVGLNTVIGGSLPSFFWVNLVTNPRNSRLYHRDGLQELIQTARAALEQERPAHTDYQLRIQGHPMQIGVDYTHEVGARVGDTTLVGGAPLTIPGDSFA
ncbi:MAG: hypothetical protein DYG89_49025 [Caldilinea sp. CFX5]|nr:hypothetical protein [Caldilinea sp. CFX5]